MSPILFCILVLNILITLLVIIFPLHHCLYLEAIERVQGGGLRGKVIINIAGEESFEGSTGRALYYNRDSSKPLQ